MNECYSMSQLRIILLVFLLLTTSLSGCTSEEDDTEEKPPKPGFSWPEQVEAGCDTSSSDVLKCRPYYDIEDESEHAVLTLRHPI